MTNHPATVDASEFTVRRTVTIRASVDAVWRAVTEPEHIAKWFGQTATIDRLAVGGEGVLAWDDYGDFPIRIEEIDPKSLIAYRWSNENATPGVRIDADHSTVFTFTLSALGEKQTQLTVVETGFSTLADPVAAMESNRGGWDGELDELVGYLEGEPTR